jgi:hypothetical protein
MSSTFPPVLNPDPGSIFGRIVAGSDVEDWCSDLLKRWFSTYLSEVERQHGLPELFYSRPRAFVPTVSFDKWPEDQLPALMVSSTGTPQPPKRLGDGTYRAWWLMGLYVVCSARTQAESKVMARHYTAAVRDLFLQRPSLDGQANGTDWVDEDYRDLTYDDLRSLSSGAVHFIVEVENVASANAGPLSPDSPSDDPWAHWPTVQTHEETVINYGTDPLPEED